MQPRLTRFASFFTLSLLTLLLVAFTPLTSFAGSPESDAAGNNLAPRHGSSMTHSMSQISLQSDINGTHYLYVNDGSQPNTVSGFKVTKKGISPLPGSPYATGGEGEGVGSGGNELAVSSDHSCLFASDDFSKSFNSFRINTDHSLMLVTHATLHIGFPSGIVVSPKGGAVFLDLFNYSPSFIVSYTVNQDCSIIRDQFTNIGNFLDSIALSPDGSLLFASSFMGDFINSYSVSGTTLTLLKTLTPKSLAPDGLVVSGSHLYSGNVTLNGAQTGAYSYSQDGTLTELPGSPAVDPQGSDSAQVWYDKADQQVISSEQQSNSFGMYAMVKGAYTFLAHAAGAGSTPTQFAQLGYTLFVTNDNSGNVSEYTVARGKLTFQTLLFLPVSRFPNGLVAF